MSLKVTLWKLISDLFFLHRRTSTTTRTDKAARRATPMSAAGMLMASAKWEWPAVHSIIIQTINNVHWKAMTNNNTVKTTIIMTIIIILQ